TKPRSSLPAYATTPLSAATTLVPAGALILTPSLFRPPFFGPKPEMTWPFTGQRKRSPPRGAGVGSGGMAATLGSVGSGADAAGGGFGGTLGAVATGVVVCAVLSGTVGMAAAGVERTMVDCVADCCVAG